jgi:uncharacterized protein
MDDGRLFEDRVIDFKPRRRRVGLLIIAGLVLAVLFFGSQLLTIYVDALWFNSVGYSEVFWYKFRFGALLFITFFIVTALVIRLPLALVGRAFPQLTEKSRLKVASVEDLKDVNFMPMIFRPGAWILAIVAAFLSAASMSQSWSDFALYVHAQTAQTTDPIFNKDAGFYLFRLPAIELVVGWFLALSVVMLIAVAATALYVRYLESMRGGLTGALRNRVISAISLAAIPFAIALAIDTYLDRFDLLRERHELFTGANYTDANVKIQAMNIIAGLLILSAMAMAINAVSLRRPRVIIGLAALVVLTWLLGTVVIPQSIYSFSVKPNELAKEAPYIDHNIKMTRLAFGIESGPDAPKTFEERPFPIAPTLTAQQIQENRDTLDNVRLWDRGALKATLSQIQEIRTYYHFNTPDVDRYMINGRLRQVMITAREINTAQLPEQSKNWINEHLIYTHGYGVTMNTVNEFTPEGRPQLVLKNMPVESEAPEIKISRPEVYFGESTDTHVYVRTKPQGTTQPEFNYPAPDNTDSYTTYEGGAGVPVGGLFRKLALSIHLGDGTNLLFSDYITPESRVLLNRNVLARVRQIAPFIIFDDDPYIVVSRDGRLYWTIDGFTTSDRYPYSALYQLGNETVNYIRNSVKAVIDAYEGTVTFYVFDRPDDPIIKAYQSIFPSLFHPSSEMPEDLREHVRYPSLLVNLQARVYTLYHMQNPQTFYNHEDLWAIAAAEQPAQKDAEPPPMAPYHVLMKLPGEGKKLEFLNILPFTPTGVGRSNMIGWMAARADGENYGHTLVYTFPKNITVNGPAQVRALVNQDPQLSQQMTLWNQKGSELLRGSLLVIPLADSLLYVEAFYLQAEGGTSKLPELRQVALATQDRLATGKTFEEALRKLFPDLDSKQPVAPQLPAAQTAQAAPAQQPLAKPSAQQQASTAESDRMLKQAAQLLSDYERLTAAGKHREAGEKLDQLRQLLNAAGVR